MNNNYPFLQSNSQLNENFLKKIVLVVNLLMNGKTNNTGSVALTPSATSTTVQNGLVNVNSLIVLQPISEDGAEHFKDIWPEAGDKQFIIHHNNNPSTDRILGYVIIG